MCVIIASVAFINDIYDQWIEDATPTGEQYCCRWILANDTCTWHRRINNFFAGRKLDVSIGPSQPPILFKLNKRHTTVANPPTRRCYRHCMDFGCVVKAKRKQSLYEASGRLTEQMMRRCRKNVTEKNMEREIISSRFIPCRRYFLHGPPTSDSVVTGYFIICFYHSVFLSIHSIPTLAS